MRIEKRVLYFYGDTQVIQLTRGLAAELGISERALRSWAGEPGFPEPVHTEPCGKLQIHYYPYTATLEWLSKRLDYYYENRKRGVGRPAGAVRHEEKVRVRPA